MASDGVIKSDFMRFFSESLLQLYLKDYFNEQRVVSCCESDPLSLSYFAGQTTAMTLQMLSSLSRN